MCETEQHHKSLRKKHRSQFYYFTSSMEGQDYLVRLPLFRREHFSIVNATRDIPCKALDTCMVATVAVVTGKVARTANMLCTLGNTSSSQSCIGLFVHV